MTPSTLTCKLHYITTARGTIHLHLLSNKRR